MRCCSALNGCLRVSQHREVAGCEAVEKLRRQHQASGVYRDIMMEGRTMAIGLGLIIGMALFPYVKDYVLEAARAIWCGADKLPHQEDEDDDGGRESEEEAAFAEERTSAIELRQQYVNGELDVPGRDLDLRHIIRERMAGTFASSCDQLLDEHLDTSAQGFFKEWLDPYLQLSCAQRGSPGIEDLATAQVEKMKAVAQQLELEPGMRVLDIECGWGGLACYLAKHHGVQVTGISRRVTNIDGARLWAESEGLTNCTRFVQGDSSLVDESFHRVVCVSLQEINRIPSEVEFNRLLCADGMALVHRMIFESSVEPAQGQYGGVPYIVVRQVTDLTADLLATVKCWLHRLAQEWSRGKLKDFGPQKRAWEFTLICIAAACKMNRHLLQEVIYEKTQPRPRSTPE